MLSAPLPSPFRVGLGFLIGPAVGALVSSVVLSLLLGTLHFIVGFAAYALIFGYAHTLTLGLPAYLVLRRRVPLTARKAIVGAVVVASMPSLLFILWMGLAHGFAGVVSASPELAFLLAIFIGAGAISGLVFWKTVGARASQPR